jgi:hypothetical protein
MIAQVFISKLPAGPMSDELRKFTEDAMAEARTRDGVEGSLSVFDPTTGETLYTVLFRDQAALDAYQGWANEKIAEVEELVNEVGSGRVYSEVIADL